MTAVKEELHSNAVIAEDFNTPVMDVLPRHKIKETVALNDTLEQMDLSDIFSTSHPEATDYTFSQVHKEYFPRWAHVWP